MGFLKKLSSRVSKFLKPEINGVSKFLKQKDSRIPPPSYVGLLSSDEEERLFSQDEKVRTKVINEIIDHADQAKLEEIVEKHWSIDLRVAAIGKIENQPFLEKFATAKGRDEDGEDIVISAAVEKLKNKDVLKEISTRTGDGVSGRVCTTASKRLEELSPKQQVILPVIQPKSNSFMP